MTRTRPNVGWILIPQTTGAEFSPQTTLRAIYGSRAQEYSLPLFNSLKILTLCNVNSYMTGMYDFRSIHHLHIFNHFSPYICIYNTRLSQRNVIDVVYPGTTHSKQSIVFMGAKVWNAIPLVIRESATCDTYKLHYKRYLLSLQSETWWMLSAPQWGQWMIWRWRARLGR